ncbi:baseplate assembly protein W [Bordetella phage vB_BbrM_PHB04]|uniref:Baseplate assembly protein W n=1 Tax=Bordetella phage vB_BbrM_PHB04 TaxID=2029657 RepID=A0A291L9V1_9CAUD|nr:baseplate protein [Bordetella phage vB_BbrM_PHB04]ATI15622.1 baseplate assembly protein W [Bordetella phage vB_BbrM_PHB04]
MTTPFSRPMYGFRFEETRRGDTLKAIAARTLGDAGRWHELIAFNKLVPPYITDDPAQVKPGVILTGELLLVPAPAPAVTTSTDPQEVFQRDIRLENGMLAVDGGDFLVAAGRENFTQAIRNRVETETGELIHHMDYGNRTRRLLGAVNGPTASLLAAQYTRSAVLADPRVRRVVSATAEVIGDVVNVGVKVEPVSGQPAQIEANP